MFCSIALIFLTGIIFTTLYVDGKNKALIDSLDKDQKQKYHQIKEKRRHIFSISIISGFIISLISLFFLRNNSKIVKVCLVGAITLVTSYFVYSLYPKGDFMISHLKTDDQREKWLAVYKEMKYKYHLGLLTGLLASLLLIL